jgi:hypothetical protein
MAVPIGNAFADARLDEATLTLALREHTLGAVPRYERLWAYYRNPQTPIGTARAGAHASTSAGAHVTHATSRRYHQAQECGLPPRITGDYGAFPGLALGLMDDRAHARREKVIENDIAWRLSSMVDFLLGKPVTIHSLARDAALREALTRFLDQLFEHSGGIALLQDMALLCHVYGHVDFFKNNYYFSVTNRRMVDTMANHATRVRNLIDRLGLERVEAFLDTCLSLDNLVDYQAPYIQRPSVRSEPVDEYPDRTVQVHKLPARSYMDEFINPPELIEQQRQQKGREMEEEEERRGKIKMKKKGRRFD